MEPFVSCYPGTCFAGVDEVGRGPLAGDVVAAAVILDPAQPIDGLNDSKKLTEKRREQLYDEIQAKALSWCIARASVAEIDKINILQASLLAMHRAVQGLATQPEHVLVDGNKIPRWDYPAEAVVKGDSRVPAISAASILAKVCRDREMIALDQRYPGYGFAGHKGYPTKTHLDALQRLGVTPVHRTSFGPVKALLEQIELF
ncbi:ribonuclease HII [Marinimicrobium alkaliphilum]|uniref:ribonuclease HII n=1 Tax=Marinimicrobium alkaliphilum TaxID=2202654 RepID=UPI000DB930F0|nr:ribonuclease HII [Marinimicrobium alkaliphilum]